MRVSVPQCHRCKTKIPISTSYDSLKANSLLSQVEGGAVLIISDWFAVGLLPLCAYARGAG